MSRKLHKYSINNGFCGHSSESIMKRTMIFTVLVVATFLISAAEPGRAGAKDNPGQPNDCFLTSEKKTVRPADSVGPPVILRCNCLASGAKRGRKHLQGSKSSKNLEA
jgi:hypothetical protein